MKFSILAVYTRIVDKLQVYGRFIKYIWAFIFLTWVAVIVVTLVECRPFNQWVFSSLLPIFNSQERAFSDIYSYCELLQL